jgi:hypothetical protein
MALFYSSHAGAALVHRSRRGAHLDRLLFELIAAENESPRRSISHQASKMD